MVVRNARSRLPDAGVYIYMPLLLFQVITLLLAGIRFTNCRYTFSYEPFSSSIWADTLTGAPERRGMDVVKRGDTNDW